jgi:hypothetical protein
MTFADTSKNPPKPVQQKQPKTNPPLHSKKAKLLPPDNKTLQNKIYNASEICLNVYYNERI